MSRKSSRKKWMLAGIAPLAAGAVWWIGRAISGRRRRSPGRSGRRPMPPQPYGLEKPPDFPLSEMGLPMDAYAVRRPTQVPVTARKAAEKHPAPQQRGAAKAYDHSAAPSSRPSGESVDEKRSFPWLAALIPFLILAALTVFSLLDRQPARAQVITVPGGNIEAGRQAIQVWGCGSCHTIPGVPGAYGKVGPKLDQMAEQTYIAGMLSNTPNNLMNWIMNPQEIQPGNAMPNTGVSVDAARDMAAYLYSLR